jgi:hypothetical protein
MSQSSVAIFGSLAGFVALWVAAPGSTLYAQERGGTPQTDKVQPVNSGSNPYRVIRDWATLNIE